MPDTIHLSSMRNYFETGITHSEKFRRQQLQQLKKSILKHKAAISSALSGDLKKSVEESWITETGFVLAEINYALRNLATWMDREPIGTALLNLPSRSFLM